jgi:hypothetical protein
MHYNIRVLILLIPSYELYFGSVELEIPNYCKDVKKKLVVVQKITKTQREREREREEIEFELGDTTIKMHLLLGMGWKTFSRI